MAVFGDLSPGVDSKAIADGIFKHLKNAYLTKSHIGTAGTRCGSAAQSSPSWPCKRETSKGDLNLLLLLHAWDDTVLSVFPE